MLRPSAGETLRAWLLSALVVHGAVAGNPDAKRLYDDLLSNYNKLVRPVVNTSDVLRVCIKLKLSQLIDVRWQIPNHQSCPREKHQGKCETAEKHLNPPSNLQSGSYIIPTCTQFVSVSQMAIDSQSIDKSSSPTCEEFLKIKKPHAGCFLKNRRIKPVMAYWKGDTPVTDIKSDKPRLKAKNQHECTNCKLHGASHMNDKPLKIENFVPKINLKWDTSSKTEFKHDFCTCPARVKKRKVRPQTEKHLPQKYTNICSKDDLKEILRNFKIVAGETEEEGQSERSKNVLPAYFVLKLAEDDNSKNRKRNLTERSNRTEDTKKLSDTQSFRLIFANDDFKKPSKCKTDEISQLSLQSSFQMKDNFSQTIQMRLDEMEKELKSETLNCPIETEKKEKTETVQRCVACLKMEEDFKFQREFSATLLEQMKNMLAQLTALIAMLNNLLHSKESNDEEEDIDFMNGPFIQNVSTLKNKIFANKMGEMPNMLRSVRPVLDSIGSVSFGGSSFSETVTGEDSLRVLKNCYKTIDKKVSTVFYPEKNKNVYCLTHVESDYPRQKKIRKAIESSR